MTSIAQDEKGQPRQQLQVPAEAGKERLGPPPLDTACQPSSVQPGKSLRKFTCKLTLRPEVAHGLGPL